MSTSKKIFDYKLLFFIVFYKVYKNNELSNKYRIKKRVFNYFILVLIISPVTILLGGLKLFIKSLLTPYINWDRCIISKDVDTFKHKISLYKTFSEAGDPFHLWNEL